MKLFQKRAARTLAGDVQAVRVLLSDESRWTFGHASELADGSSHCDGDHPDAVKWCLLGAIHHEVPMKRRTLIESFLADLVPHDVRPPVQLGSKASSKLWTLNDTRGYESVTRLLDEAAIVALNAADLLPDLPLAPSEPLLPAPAVARTPARRRAPRALDEADA